MIQTDTISNCISVNSIFDSLKEDEINLLRDTHKHFAFKRNDLLYREGSKINGLYCILDGIIKIYKTGTEGKEQIIRFSQKGEIIGFRSVLSNEFACTSAKAIENSTVCFIPSHTLFSIVGSNNNFSLELMKLTCRELGEANKFILNIAQKTVRERLAEILLILNETFETDKDGSLRLVITREEIANLIGTATESVIRLLSEFKSDSIISLHGRKIKLLNIPKLKKMANK